MDETFPPPELADPDGIVAIGGSLDPDRVTAAYRQGIFPWPLSFGDGMILTWCSPDPRAVIELDQLHVSRRLRRRIRSGQFRITCDQQFARVIASCAAPRKGEPKTWITPEIMRTYTLLHRKGITHSIEVWQKDQLVGGLYGVALGGFFAGESMFHSARDASKTALVYLVAHLRARGYELFDIQQTTDHSSRMGATEIPRSRFLARLRAALALPVTFGDRLDTSQLNRVINRPHS